ncbi:hypothetical protein LCI18_006749 [Fusarium solani-melongenae]|uniref:Uncharacterized protein n=1 Tax=Fusarium solani subsp. cucurbitae TaxID=2747967 RepID=A0ACD3Z3H9_FUSSC|nr:hypothetical protein LCI18_006749 [Fusarium solani-melongenae]
MATPEQRLIELTKVEGRLEESTLAQVFDQLKPIEAEFMIGKWKGGSFESGHPVHEQLTSLKWAGKDFRSVNDVDPLMVYDNNGNRSWNTEYGHARLRDFKFRGVVSAAMVYDTFPIIDQFRYVSETMVMGAMDSKDIPEGAYFFYLTRLE